MAFVKLDVGILDSSVWSDLEASRVFVTAMAMAVPHELTEPAQVYDPGTQTPSGWCVPPGWYGFIDAADEGIVRRAMALRSRGPGMTIEHAMAALLDLCSPDPRSKSKDFDGRRLAQIEGGFVVLNFMRYREKDHGNAEKCARWRAKQAAKRASSGVDTVSTPRRPVSTRVDRSPDRCRDTQAEAEAEAEASLPTGEREQLALAAVATPTPPPAPSTSRRKGKGATKAPPCSDDEWSAVMEGYRVAREIAGLGERWGVYKDNHENRAKVARIYQHHADADVAVVFQHIGRKIRDGTFGDVKYAGLEYVMRAMDRYLNEAAAADYEPKEQRTRQRPGGAFVPRGEYKNL